MSSPVNLRNPGRAIHVSVVLLNSTSISRLWAFLLASAAILSRICLSFVLSDNPKAQALDFEFHWITENGERPGHLTDNLNVPPTDSFTTCPPLDIAVLRAHKVGYQASETEKEFLRKRHAGCVALLCICGGFEPILFAGLLEDETATAPRRFIPLLQQGAPGTNWVEKRWVHNGKTWTSGTLLNGFDMVAAFGRDAWGGKNTLLEHCLPEMAWPERDVDYTDVPRISS